MLDMLPGITNTRRHARTHPPTHARQQRRCNSLRDTGHEIRKGRAGLCGLRDRPLCPWVALAVCGSHFALEACLVLLCSGRRPSKGHQHVANKGHATRICDIEAVPPAHCYIAKLLWFILPLGMRSETRRDTSTKDMASKQAAKRVCEYVSFCLCERERERVWVWLNRSRIGRKTFAAAAATK